MIVSDISQNIILLEFPDQEIMCKTMLRFQEYYESSEFRGKVFTLKEFKEWYMEFTGRKTKSGKPKFTYYEDWNGFNFPGYIVEAFRDGLFKRITKREQGIIDIYEQTSNRCYFIAICEGDHRIYDHEVAHALYYTNDNYKQIVETIMEKWPVDKDFYNFLESKGYHRSVLDDEVHAYLATEDSDFQVYFDAEETSRRLKNNLDQYKKNILVVK